MKPKTRKAKPRKSTARPAAPKPRKVGRPEYAPTDKERQQVRVLTGMGLILKEVSAVMQISVPTITKHFEKELATGALEANAAVAQSLYRQATHKDKPSTVAGIFWMKARAGWRDGNGPGGGRMEDPAEPEGKKAKAVADARTAAAGTSWEELLPTARSLQ